MKTIELGLPCAPSTLISKKEIEVIKIIVCYFGESKETLYIMEYVTSENFMQIKYFNGYERQINLNFVASIEKVKAVRIRSDITNYRNFNKDPSQHVKGVTEEHVYEIKKDEDWTFINKYIYNGNGVLQGKKINLSR